MREPIGAKSRSERLAGACHAEGAGGDTSVGEHAHAWGTGVGERAQAWGRVESWSACVR